jgi:hypothetical protein
VKAIRIATVAAAFAAATLAPAGASAGVDYHVGQKCSKSKQRQYQLKGFICVKKHGTYRLKRQGMTF